MHGLLLLSCCFRCNTSQWRGGNRRRWPEQNRRQLVQRDLELHDPGERLWTLSCEGNVPSPYGCAISVRFHEINTIRYWRAVRRESRVRTVVVHLAISSSGPTNLLHQVISRSQAPPIGFGRVICRVGIRVQDPGGSGCIVIIDVMTSNVLACSPLLNEVL